MSGDLLSDLIHALELFGMERRPNSSIVAITLPPSWLTPILEASADAPFTLARAFPFLEGFMREAEAMWHDATASRIVSGAFTAAAGSDELLLRASALTLGTRCVLVLERLHGDADARPLMQRARENKLDYERLVRQIETLQTSMSTTARLAKELLQTELTSGQRDLAGRIDQTATHATMTAAGGGPPATRPR